MSAAELAHDPACCLGCMVCSALCVARSPHFHLACLVPSALDARRDGDTIGLHKNQQAVWGELCAKLPSIPAKSGRLSSSS